MPLDFPSSPTNGQVYQNYYYDGSAGAWRSLSSTVNPIPSTLKNLTISSTETTGVSLRVTPFTTSSVNLQEWYNTSSTVVASMNVAGEMSLAGLTLATDLTVPNGGTGAASFTSGAYLKGAGTSPITAQTGIPAGDITSGTLGVARGGTGVATLTGYAKGSGTNAFSAVTTIPVADGGTGATTLTSGGYLKGAGTAAITAQTGIPATDLTGTLSYDRFPAGTVVGFNRIYNSAVPTYSVTTGVVLSGLNISITPKYANSILVVQWMVTYEAEYNSIFRVYRDGSLLNGSFPDYGYNYTYGSSPLYSGFASVAYDTDIASTPNTQMIQATLVSGNTNATTLQLAIQSSTTATIGFKLNRAYNNITDAYEVGVSTATIWEIKQ